MVSFGFFFCEVSEIQKKTLNLKKKSQLCLKFKTPTFEKVRSGLKRVV